MHYLLLILQLGILLQLRNLLLQMVNLHKKIALSCCVHLPLLCTLQFSFQSGNLWMNHDGINQIVILCISLSCGGDGYSNTQVHMVRYLQYPYGWYGTCSILMVVFTNSPAFLTPALAKLKILVYIRIIYACTCNSKITQLVCRWPLLPERLH